MHAFGVDQYFASSLTSGWQDWKLLGITARGFVLIWKAADVGLGL
jgi:hypothetical protein